MPFHQKLLSSEDEYPRLFIFTNPNIGLRFTASTSELAVTNLSFMVQLPVFSTTFRDSLLKESEKPPNASLLTHVLTPLSLKKLTKPDSSQAKYPLLPSGAYTYWKSYILSPFLIDIGFPLVKRPLSNRSEERRVGK